MCLNSDVGADSLVVLLTIVDLQTLRSFAEDSAEDPPPSSPLRISASLVVIYEGIVEAHACSIRRWSQQSMPCDRRAGDKIVCVPIDPVFSMNANSSLIRKSCHSVTSNHKHCANESPENNVTQISLRSFTMRASRSITWYSRFASREETPFEQGTLSH